MNPELTDRDNYRAALRMSKNIAALVQWPDAFEYASGLVICEKCGLPYNDHPHSTDDFGTFVLSCEGKLLKT